jgi:hypothetical protein
MSTIKQTETHKIPYLKASAVAGRTVLLMPLWDGEAWHQWFASDGNVYPMQMVDAVRLFYVAKAPARADDINFSMLEFIWQRASVPDNIERG